jgi:hypothetical protein
MNSNTKPGNGNKPHDAHETAKPTPPAVSTKTATSPNMHDGKIVSVLGNKLVSTCHEGKQHSHTVAADAKVTCDGATCKTEDLKPGAKIRVTTKPEDQHTATKVESLQKHHEFAKT